MRRRLSERNVLKKLGITDFRHMTKEKVISFTSMLPYMDSEVAKKALEQFPEFAKLATGIASEFKSIIDKCVDGNKSESKAFIDACNRILSSLEKSLEKQNLTYEEEQEIINEMISVAKMIGEKGESDKQFYIKMTTLAGLFGLGFLAVGASVLGSNTKVNKDGSEEDEL